jgi:hypothetical protein
MLSARAVSLSVQKAALIIGQLQRGEKREVFRLTRQQISKSGFLFLDAATRTTPWSVVNPRLLAAICPSRPQNDAEWTNPEGPALQTQ